VHVLPVIGKLHAEPEIRAATVADEHALHQPLGDQLHVRQLAQNLGVEELRALDGHDAGMMNDE